MKQLFFVLACWLSFTVTWATDKSHDRCRVCFFNLQNYRLAVHHEATSGTTTFKSESQQKLIEATLLRIHPEVLALSEIGDLKDLQHLQTTLANQGLHLPHCAITGGADPHRKLAVLSKYPLKDWSPQEIPRYALGGKVHLMGRGLLEVTVHPPSHASWRLIVVHLKSQREVPEGDQAWMRRSEAFLVRKHLDDRLSQSPDPPVILCGDFNDYKNQASIRSIEGKRGHPAHMQAVTCRDLQGHTWTHYWKDADQYSRFDYFFLNRAAWPWLISREGSIEELSDASDHRPIWMDLAPKPNGPSKQEIPDATSSRRPNPSSPATALHDPTHPTQ